MALTFDRAVAETQGDFVKLLCGRTRRVTVGPPIRRGGWGSFLHRAHRAYRHRHVDDRV